MILEAKYGLMIFLVFSFFLVEMIISIITGSLSLRADAFHMLTDLIALIVALVSLRMSKFNRSLDYTYGWLRMEVIGATVNSVILLTICLTMFLESIEKIVNLRTLGEEVVGIEEIDLVLIVAGCGLLVNLLGLALFCGHAGHSHSDSHSHSHAMSGQEKLSTDIESSDGSMAEIRVDILENGTNQVVGGGGADGLNGGVAGGVGRISKLEVEVVKEIATENYDFNHLAIMLHIVGDVLGSLVVIGSGLGIKYGRQSWRFYLDPIATMVIILILGFSGVKLLIKCFNILIHRIPKGMNLSLIQEEISKLPSVHTLHEFHLWSLTSSVVVATCHLKVHPDGLNSECTDTRRSEVLTEVKKIFHRVGIHSSTVQLEYDHCEPVCLPNCHELRCCSS